MNYYNGIAKGYNSLYMAEQMKKFENTRNLIGNYKLALDLGCGTGFITEHLNNIIGVDSSVEMLKLCPDNLKIVCADISKLPFKNGIFDLVYSLTTLQDVDDVNAAILEIKRVIKPNGRIVLSVLNKSKINEIRKILKKEFENLKEKENYNDIVFFTQ